MGMELLSSSWMGCGLWAQSAIGNKPREKTSRAAECLFISSFLHLIEWIYEWNQIERKERAQFNQTKQHEMKKQSIGLCVGSQQLISLWMGVGAERAQREKLAFHYGRSHKLKRFSIFSWLACSSSSLSLGAALLFIHSTNELKRESKLREKKEGSQHTPHPIQEREGTQPSLFLWSGPG